MKRTSSMLMISAMAVALTASGTTAMAAKSTGTPQPAAVAPVAPGTSDSPRGTLVSAERLRTLTAREAAAELAGDKAGAWDTGAVRYGLTTYRIVYRTVDPHGRPIRASGLLALPHNGERRLRTVSFTHGTELSKTDVASVSTSVWDQAPALTHASAGFATVLPDYLGLGSGPGPHPWMDVLSETTAALDMLRASRAVARAQGRELRRDVLVTGFSQGASAALGLARSLQEGADGWFRLRAVAPISGAYAFRDAELPALLSGRTEPKASVIYAALTLVAFNRLHHLYDTPAQVFRAPYDRTIEGLLDGTHTGREVEAGTPDTVDALLTPRGRAMLAHPTGRLAAALRTADSVCTDWTPRAPIRLYYADADEQAVTANTAHCQAALRARGVHVPAVNLGTPDYGGSRHLGSQQAGTAAVVRWFLALRQGAVFPSRPESAGRIPLSHHLPGRMLRGMTSEDHAPYATVTTRVTVRDLLHQDLPACTWSGSPTHLRHVERELTRAAAGEVDYLAVCTPVDLPVAIGGIDYQVSEEAGTIWQLAVLPALQSCGLGTLLLRTAEQRIRDRGLRRAELAVEEDNPRARALYERLGYVAYGREPDAWDEEGPDGTVRRHETIGILMRKNL